MAQEEVENAIEEEESRREDLPSYREYELLEQSYREGGWVEIVEETVQRQREAFLDFAKDQEVRDRISEVFETRDEDGNLVHGDLPQVVGDTLMWPIIPTEQQLNSSRRGGRCSRGW